jgi:hypothetical protein
MKNARAPESRWIPGSSGSLQALVQKMDEYDARDAGLSLEAWMALPEGERIRVLGKREDEKFAKNEGMTLVEYHAERRKVFESGQSSYGPPQWLRDEYANENPEVLTAKYFEWLAAARTATGNGLKRLSCLVSAHTGRGFVDPDWSFEEMRLRLESEIDRAGLRAHYDAQQGADNVHG